MCFLINCSCSPAQLLVTFLIHADIGPLESILCSLTARGYFRLSCMSVCHHVQHHVWGEAVLLCDNVQACECTCLLTLHVCCVGFCECSYVPVSLYPWLVECEEMCPGNSHLLIYGTYRAHELAGQACSHTPWVLVHVTIVTMYTWQISFV